jgi:hypothetical protein
VAFVVPHCTVDYASEIDTLEEQLCEAFDLPMDKARLIAAWHREQLDEHTGHEDGDALNLILGALLEKGNIRLKAIGLLFAAGINRSNGWNTERCAARDTGFTPAAINAEKQAWISLLKLARNEHCKSEEAREKYRQNGKDNHWRKQFPNNTNHPSTC